MEREDTRGGERKLKFRVIVNERQCIKEKTLDQLIQILTMEGSC